MASLKCLACGHDNKVGDESCTSCSSSLNLRLCSACEAINANSAEQCHSCGAKFGAEAEVSSPADAVEREAPADEKVLPAAWVLGAEQATRRSRRLTAALWLVPVLAVAGGTYYLYRAPQATAKQLAAPQAAPVGVPRVTPVAVQKTTFEPKSALTPVTHTREGGVEAPVKETPVKETAVKETAVKETPVKVVPAAAVPTVPTLSKSTPVVVERRARVTHTKAEPGQAPEAVEAPSVVAASGPSTAAKVEPAPCAPAVAALGLCKSN